jgi:hypothetical protein
MKRIRASIFLVGFALVALVGFSGPGSALWVCDQNCLSTWPYFCYTTANGTCNQSKCFFYYPNQNPNERVGNCWVCGGPGNGWCHGGSANDECKQTITRVDWIYRDGCDSECSNPPNLGYCQATAPTGMDTYGGNGFLHICQLKPVGTGD